MRSYIHRLVLEPRRLLQGRIRIVECDQVGKAANTGRVRDQGGVPSVELDLYSR